MDSLQCKLCETVNVYKCVYLGKDSLSMAARVEDETVKSPGSLVISTYAPCEDITKTITPDLKCPNGKGEHHYNSHFNVIS